MCHYLGGTDCLTLLLSNTVSRVFYGITRLIPLIELAASFATFEENMRSTSSARKVVPPDSDARGAIGGGAAAR